MRTGNGKPDGYTALTPFLVCRPAAEAITFYCAVFEAKLVARLDGPNGIVMHAELDFGDGMLQLGDPLEDYGLVAPAGHQKDRVSSSVCVYVPDVDGTFAAAVEHGATVREEPSTFASGDRFASIYDPFGHRWAIMTKVEALSREEAEQRVAAWAAQKARTPAPGSHRGPDCMEVEGGF